MNSPSLPRNQNGPIVNQWGFTLIEALVVVLILGILAAIAFPNYQDYVRRAQASEAPAALMDGRVRIEQYYLDNRTYVGGCPSSTMTSQHFTYACNPVPTATSYTLVATGNANTPVSGHEYSIDVANVRETIKFKGTTYSPHKTCWLISGSEC